MKLFQLFETPQEITALGNLTQALTQYITGMIQAANSDYRPYAALDKKEMHDVTDDEIDIAHGEYARMKSHLVPPTRPLGLPQDTRDEWFDSMVDRIEPMLTNAKSAKHSFESTQIEVGTIGELVQRMNYKPSGFSPEVWKKMAQVWIIISDQALNQGTAYHDDPDAGSFKDGESFDGNARIVLSAYYFIRQGRINKSWINSVISHEITHQFDYINTNGKYSTKRDGSVKGMDKTTGDQVRGEEYWKLQYEVNARFTQLATDLKNKFGENGSLSKSKVDQQQVINRLQTRFKLTEPWITKEQYQQVMKRLVKYMDVENLKK